jgi:uncharacterized protein (TIGR00251 family)
VSDTVVIVARVSPRASRDDIESVDADGAIRVRVTAPPVEGAANEAVLRLVAKALGLPRSAVTLASGATARTKRLRIEGIAREVVTRHWPGVRVTG